MATTMHHHHVDTFDVPTGVYWAAGIGLVLLAALAFYYAAATTSVGPSLLDQSMVPTTVPFIPLL